MSRVPVLKYRKGIQWWFLKEVGGNDVDGWDGVCYWTTKAQNNIASRVSGDDLYDFEKDVWVGSLEDIRLELIRQKRFNADDIEVVMIRFYGPNNTFVIESINK